MNLEKIGAIVAEQYGNVSFGEDMVSHRDVRITSKGNALVKRNTTVEDLMRSTGGNKFLFWGESPEGEYWFKFDYLSDLTRFGEAPETTPGPTTPESRAADGFMDWISETASAVNVRFTGGFDLKGQRYAKVDVFVPNPNLFLQGAAAQALIAAGLEGIAVQANIGEQDKTVSFTFSVGAEPK